MVRLRRVIAGRKDDSMSFRAATAQRYSLIRSAYFSRN
jgi:hypothetical protein